MAKKTRKHIPKLNKDKLTLLVQAIDANPRISKAGKLAVKRSLAAASTGNAEAPDVIIASLPKEQRDSIMAHVAEFVTFSQGITARGRAALESLPFDEWDALVNDQPGSNPDQ